MIILFFFVWHFFQIPYLWSFVIYSTLFHYIRQTYGFLRWYEILEKKKFNHAKTITYFSAILPVVGVHFKEGFNPLYYSNEDLINYPNEILYNCFLASYGLFIAGWVVISIKEKYSLNIQALILGNIILYGLFFFNIAPEFVLAYPASDHTRAQ